MTAVPRSPSPVPHSHPWQPGELSLSSSSSSPSSVAAVVVTAVHNENVDWLSQQRYPYVIVTADPGRANDVHNVPFASTGVAAGYLRFIIEHYDHLPPRVLFVNPDIATWLDQQVRCCREPCGLPTLN